MCGRVSEVLSEAAAKLQRRVIVTEIIIWRRYEEPTVP